MTITIQGVPPRFEQKELDQRKASYQDLYYNTMECRKFVRADLPYQFILSIMQHTTEGYVLDEKAPVVMESLNYRATMFKPKHMQIADLEAAQDGIKAGYVLYLETQREKYKQLLKAQLLERDEIKQAEKIASAKAKRLLEIENEINSTFTELVIPD